MNNTVDSDQRTRFLSDRRGGAAVDETNALRLDWAILQTLAYADVFDFPLYPGELHRYLIGLPASLETISHRLAIIPCLNEKIDTSRGLWFLRGREHLVEIRHKRARESRQLWPAAVHFGNRIARLPFVRMVAVTGALAVDNLGERRDIDYLVVTEPGRLWLCRALVIAQVRLAAREGVALCPNYFLSTESLAHTDRDLYSAHELTQMVPLAGIWLYTRMRALNRWIQRYLPNASAGPRRAQTIHPDSQISLPRQLCEQVLRTPAGGWIESWEMNRKIMRFQDQAVGNQEAQFCADWCKGHFDGHARRTVEAYQNRLDDLGVPLEVRIL